jgi:hypothetical protein
MSVTIESLTPLKAANPARLFTVGIDTAAARERARSTAYDVMPDGQRFLVSVPSGEPASSRIAVILNWPADLAR